MRAEWPARCQPGPDGRDGGCLFLLAMSAYFGLATEACLGTAATGDCHVSRGASRDRFQIRCGVPQGVHPRWYTALSPRKFPLVAKCAAQYRSAPAQADLLGDDHKGRLVATSSPPSRSMSTGHREATTASDEACNRPRQAPAQVVLLY